MRSHSLNIFTCARKFAIGVGEFDAIALATRLVVNKKATRMPA